MKDGVLESGGEPFDLAFDGLSHVKSRARRDVGVGISCVFPLRSPTRVQFALLAQQDKWLFWVVIPVRVKVRYCYK